MSTLPVFKGSGVRTQRGLGALIPRPPIGPVGLRAREEDGQGSGLSDWPFAEKGHMALGEACRVETLEMRAVGDRSQGLRGPGLEVGIWGSSAGGPWTRRGSLTAMPSTLKRADVCLWSWTSSCLLFFRRASQTSALNHQWSHRTESTTRPETSGKPGKMCASVGPQTLEIKQGGPWGVEETGS